MNILLTNDDGYNGAGILALARRLSKEHKVFIVAPEKEKSGASHAVSFFGGIKCRKVKTFEDVESYAVDGTPADCVLFALRFLLKDAVDFDVVISGINSVLNVGTDIMYSGTFGAAQEATYQQHKGIAVSLAARRGDYNFAADFIADNLQTLMLYADGRVTVNVNIPFEEREYNAGVRVAPVAFRPYDEKYTVKLAENGDEVYFVKGKPYTQRDSGADNDGTYIDNGFITVTPVEMLSTAKVIEEMRKADFKL